MAHRLKGFPRSQGSRLARVGGPHEATTSVSTVKPSESERSSLYALAKNVPINVKQSSAGCKQQKIASIESEFNLKIDLDCPARGVSREATSYRLKRPRARVLIRKHSLAILLVD